MAEGENFTIPEFPETTDDIYLITKGSTTTQVNSSGISGASILITGIMLSVHMIWSRLRSKFVSKNAVNNPEIPSNLAQMKQL